MIHGRVLHRSALAGLLITAACTPQDHTATWTGRRDTIAGVEVVWNPAEPLHPSGATAELLWEAGSESDAESDSLWEQPSVARVAGSRVYVLDRMASRVYVLNTVDGRWVRTLGRPGGGPGEFEQPFGIAIVGDSVIVGNSRGNSLEVFDTEGNYGRTIRIERVGFTLFALPDRRLLISGFAGPESDMWMIRTLDGTADPVPAAIPDSSVTGDDLFGSDCLAVGVAGPLVVRPACRTPQFALATPDGRVVREIRVNREPEAATEAELQAYADRMRQQMGQVLSGAQIDQIVERSTALERLKRKYMMVRADTGLGVYALREQNPRDLGGGPATLHLFSESGVFLSSLTFEREWVEYDMHAGTVYALTEDPDTGLRTVRAYRLSLPEF
jgi:hypothetical protein